MIPCHIWSIPKNTHTTKHLTSPLKRPILPLGILFYAVASLSHQLLKFSIPAQPKSSNNKRGQQQRERETEIEAARQWDREREGDTHNANYGVECRSAGRLCLPVTLCLYIIDHVLKAKVKTTDNHHEMPSSPRYAVTAGEAATGGCRGS